MSVGSIVGRAAIAAGGAAAVAVPVVLLHKSLGRKAEEHRQEWVDYGKQVRSEWDAWKTKLDAQFPGGNLDTSADHARFEQFLKANPAPEFVKAEHKGVTNIKLAYDWESYPDHLSSGATESGFATGGALAMGIAGAAMLGKPAFSGPMGLQTALMAAVAGAALVGGLGMAWMTVVATRHPGGTEGYAAVRKEISEYGA